MNLTYELSEATAKRYEGILSGEAAQATQHVAAACQYHVR
jgi:hypothetical protein